MSRRACFAISLGLGAAVAGPARADRGVSVHGHTADETGEPLDVRLSGEELAERGAVDLASALALIPDVNVRDSGRGTLEVDIRGARNGAVVVLVDGVDVADPWYGSVDVAAIPITDISQILVSTTPRSPIDGPGGAGGVIDVRTIAGLGWQLVVARLTGASQASVGVSGLMRTELAHHVGLRVSASGTTGARDLEIPGGSVRDDRRTATGAGQLEYRNGQRSIVLDGFVDDRHYLAPPSDSIASPIVVIDRDTEARASLTAIDQLGSFHVAARGWAQYLHRITRSFVDTEFQTESRVEDLSAIRTGAMALVSRIFKSKYRLSVSGTVEHEKALVVDIHTVGTRGETTLAELALDGQYVRSHELRVEAAAGVVIPSTRDGSGWPEGSLTAIYHPRWDFTVTTTAAYTARLATLRERFDAVIGNVNLAPEQVAHAEVRAVEDVLRFHFELAPFVRRSTGTIGVSTATADMGRLVNQGTVETYGVDATVAFRATKQFDVGGSYGFVRAHSEDTGDDPIDQLPLHRIEAWVEATPVERLSFIARARYFSSSFDQTTTLDGYALVDLTATARLGTAYVGVLRLDDLLDARPMTRTGFRLPGRVLSLMISCTW